MHQPDREFGQIDAEEGLPPPKVRPAAYRAVRTFLTSTSRRRPHNTRRTHDGAGAGQPDSRVWFVDNLRVLLISLVILHHIACIYSGLPAWYYTEQPTNGAVGLGLTLLHADQPGLVHGRILLLSGYFTPRSYDRKGPRAFLRDRLIRLGIPLRGVLLRAQPDPVPRRLPRRPAARRLPTGDRCRAAVVRRSRCSSSTGPTPPSVTRPGTAATRAKLRPLTYPALIGVRDSAGGDDLCAAYRHPRWVSRCRSSTSRAATTCRSTSASSSWEPWRPGAAGSRLPSRPGWARVGLGMALVATLDLLPACASRRTRSVARTRHRELAVLRAVGLWLRGRHRAWRCSPSSGAGSTPRGRCAGTCPVTCSPCT